MSEGGTIGRVWESPPTCTAVDAKELPYGRGCNFRGSSMTDFSSRCAFHKLY